MDQGIIQTLKLKFRKRQIQFVLNAMDKDKTKSGSEILRQISVLDKIYWINTAWKTVEASTIQKCFRHCGFMVSSESYNEHDEQKKDEYESVPLMTSKICNELFDCDFRDLVVIDNEIATTNLDGECPSI